MTALTVAVLAFALQTPDPLVEQLRQQGEPAIETLVAAAADHHTLLISDVHVAASPKILAACLIRELSERDLLDAVALEVPMTQAAVIDRYLAAAEDDPQLLVDHPLALRSHWGMSREYLDIYRTVRHARDDGHQLEIIAIDQPRGPPAVGSALAALRRYVNRDAVMAANLARWRRGNPDGRVLVLVGGLHTLKGVKARLSLGKDSQILVPLAARLEAQWPGQVFAAYSDVEVATGGPGTRILRSARLAFGGGGGVTATAPAGELDAVEDPLALSVPEPLQITLRPADYRLSDVTDLYLYHGSGAPLSALDTQSPPADACVTA